MNILEYKLKKILSGKSFSYFKSFFKGHGLEIEDFREYQHGDDKKSINWKLSAKHDKFIVNLFKKEKDTDIHVFFDINNNWHGGNSLSNIDKVSEFFFDIVKFSSKYRTKISCFYNQKGSLKLDFINKDIARAINFMHNLRSLRLQNKYISSLDLFLEFEKKISKRHIIIIFSDYLGLDKQASDNIKILSQRNEMFLIRLGVNNMLGSNYNFFTRKDNDNITTKGLHFIDIGL